MLGASTIPPPSVASPTSDRHTAAQSGSLPGPRANRTPLPTGAHVRALSTAITDIPPFGTSSSEQPTATPSP
ncbi:hypothetical protein GT037_006059 [Alternaria burnsii]|uniref:Uncharacterized protein n=1 Tax=Alternaria burnsii TaxID=1187904 RepID=A0A8H7B567_9PLEO|nr:uncharacterized protein GT037_006059 [Alternaria burnsii]KAF7676554.1 hypothetical protein GT037_006059 [Alternaria burnsii]